MNQPTHGGNLQWAAKLAGCPSSLILDFSASINPLGPPQRLLQKLRDSLGTITSYPDPSYQELCEALARSHQIPAAYVLPGNGAAELITWAARDLASLDWVGLTTPAFSDYGRSLSAFQAKIKEFPLGFPPTLAIDLPQPGERAGLLLNNPHNPTGHIWRREELLPYLEKFALVVVDEAFMDFLPEGEDQSLIPLAQNYENLVIIRSLTKFYSMPGLRLGYAIAQPDYLKQWQQWRDPWSVNVLAEVAGLAALEDLEFRQQTWAWLAPTKAKLFQALAQIPGLQPYPSAANFLLVSSQYSVTWLQEQLLQQEKILIRDCISFPELGDRYFRIAVRTEEDNQRLINSLTTLIQDQLVYKNSL